MPIRAAYPTSRNISTISHAIFREEIAELAAAGCRYIQLDEVAVALLCDPAIRQQSRSRGLRRTSWSISTSRASMTRWPARRPTWCSAFTCAAAISRATISAAAAMNRWPSGSSPHARSIISCWNTTRPRAGDFGPLRFVQGQRRGAGPGQQQDAGAGAARRLKRRTEEATQYIDLDRLAISPQCGFASTVAGNPVTEADERAQASLDRQSWAHGLALIEPTASVGI